MREYGKQGTTAVILRAEAVLQADTMMRSSIKRLCDKLSALHSEIGVTRGKDLLVRIRVGWVARAIAGSIRVADRIWIEARLIRSLAVEVSEAAPQPGIHLDDIDVFFTDAFADCDARFAICTRAHQQILSRWTAELPLAVRTCEFLDRTPTQMQTQAVLSKSDPTKAQCDANLVYRSATDCASSGWLLPANPTIHLSAS